MAHKRPRPTPRWPKAICWLALALGCSGEPERATEIVFWAMGREGEAVMDMAREFERRTPGVRVRVQQIPWSAAHEKLLTAYVGGTMPDVFQAGSTWVPELAAIGAVEPLDERVRQSPAVRRDDYFPGIWDANAIGGAVYGVPWYVDTRLLFYRTDLLAAAGYDEPPDTWGGWVESMARLSNREGQAAYGVLLPVNEWQPPVILAMQRGAGLLRDGDRYGDFQAPPFREAFAFYVDLYRKGFAPLAGAAQAANLYRDFAAGYFAYCITGPWNIGEFARRLPAAMEGKWATAPMPAPDGAAPGLSIAGGASLVLARGARRADAAWKFVEFMSEPERQAAFYRLTGDLPARMSAWRTAALAEDRYAKAFWTQLSHVRATPKIPEWERIAAKIGQYAEAAVRGRLDVEAALAALDRDVDEILEKRRSMLGAAAGGGGE